MAIFVDARVVYKVATEAEWETITLEELIKGEFYFYVAEGDPNTVINIKVGDGVRQPKDLPYMWDASIRVPFFGSATPSSTPSPASGDGFWIVSIAGTYTNYGGVVLPANSLGVITRVGGSYGILVVGIDLSGYLAKSEIEKSATSKNLANPANIIIPSVVVSNGNIQTNYANTAAFVNYQKPSGQTTFTVSGHVADSTKNAVFKDASNVVVGSVTNLNTSPKTFTWPTNAVRFDCTLRTPAEVTAGTPGYSNFQIENGASFTGYTPYGEQIIEIDNSKVSAISLLSNNFVPDAIDPDNGINKRQFDSEALKKVDMEIDPSTNLANKSVVIKDKLINSTGAIQDLSGWDMIPIDVSNLVGQNVTFGRINITTGGYSAFYNNSGTLILNNGSFNIGNQPRTYAVPSGATILYIDLKRPTDDISVYDQVTVNIGDSLLPYEDYGGTLLALDGNRIPGGGSGVTTNIITSPLVQKYDRKPTFIFEFDDGLEPSGTNLVNKFNAYGFKCGFALPSNVSGVFATFLEFQKQGFEILSHSTDGNVMNVFWDGTGTRPTNGLTLEEAETKIRNSYITLKSAGFNVNGWVTPSSILNVNFRPLVKKYYGLAHVTGFGSNLTTVVDPSNVNESYHTFNDELRTMKRVSLEASTVENILLCIDTAISNKGLVVFYAHQYPNNNTNGLSDAKLTQILDYLKTRTDSAQIDVLPPTEALNTYFLFSHEELLSLINT